jgi:hypothetical protein
MPKGLLWQRDNEVVNVKGCYLGDDGIAIDLVVTEGRLMQRFFAAIHAHREGVMVKVHDASHPDFTLGVHRAIAMLALTLKQFLPAAEIHHHTCDSRAWKEAEEVLASQRWQT